MLQHNIVPYVSATSGDGVQRAVSDPVHAASQQTSRPSSGRLSPELLLEHVLARLTVLCESSNTLVQLVKRHVVLKELPSESDLVVEERDLFLLRLL